MEPTDEAGLIATIYDAALEPATWPAMMIQVARALGGYGGGLSIQDWVTGGGRGLVGGLDPDCERPFFTYFASRNPFIRLRPVGPRPKVADLRSRPDWSVMPRERLERTEHYNDFMLRYRSPHVLMVGLDYDSDVASVLNVVSDRRPFEGEAVERSERLRPHLRRSLLVSRRLGVEAGLAQGLAGALGASGAATLLLTTDGRVRAATPAAEAVLARRDGLTVSGGRLTGTTPAVATQVARLIATAAGEGGSALSLVRPSGRRPLALIAHVLSAERAQSFLPGPGVLILIMDPEAAPTAPAARLAALFGFTPAESAVASRVAMGEDGPQISDALRISHHTVRRHLKSMFAKAEVRRQSELALLLARVSLAP